MVNKPSTPSIVEYSNIPDELQEIDQWYLYDFGSEHPKAPKNPNGTLAAWKDRDGGLEFEKAAELVVDNVTDFDALGFRFSEKDEYLFIDWDGCFRDGADWAPDIEMIAKQSYTEVSSSGEGAHTILEGEVPDWWSDADSDGEHEGVEMYESRMCIFTAKVVGTQNILHADDLQVDFEDLMLEVYKNVEDRLPPALRDNEPDIESTDKELSGDVVEALNDVDPKEIDCLLSEYVCDEGDEWEHWNPSYRNSESGESLHRNKESGIWVDWKLCEEDEDGGLLGGFGLVSLFAAERGRIEDPTQELNGEEWINAYKNLRSKSNLELPELEDADKGIDVDELRSWSQIRDGYERAYNKTERGKCDQAAVDKIRDEHHWAATREDEELYKYAEGVYNEGGATYLKEILEDGLKWQNTARKRSNITEKVISNSYVERDEMGVDDPYIVVENGVLDLIEETLHDFDPELLARHKLPVEYDSDAGEPEVFLDYLDDVVTSEEAKKKIQEFFGYTLLHWDIPFHKAMFVVGPTNSGKSTLIDILNLLHDDDAVSHVTPQELSEERFAAHQLYESWVNTRNDIPNETVQNVGKMKELIAGEELKIEQKHVDPWSFEPKAKHIFAGNQLPTASVDDSAFYERVLLVSMPRTIPREEQDRMLLYKIEKELPELLNWSIEGFHRLMEQGGFTGDRSPKETEDMWSKWSSSAKRFVHECIEFTGNKDDDTLGKDVVLEVFDEWSERRGMPSASKKTMTEVITRNPRASHTRYGGNDGSGYYEGVCWSETGGIISSYVADIGNIDEEDVKEALAESAN